jgi:hypothetical protein
MKNTNLQVDLNETILPKDGHAIAKAEELGRRLAGRNSVVPKTEADPFQLLNSPQQDAEKLVVL